MASNPSTKPAETTHSNQEYIHTIDQESLLAMKPFEYSFCQDKGSKREQFINLNKKEALMVLELNNAIEMRRNKSRSSNQSQSGQKSPLLFENISQRSLQASNRSRSPMNNSTELDDNPIITIEQIQKLYEDLECERRQKWKAQQKLKIQLQDYNNLRLDLQISAIEIQALKGQIDLLIEEKILLEHRLSEQNDPCNPPKNQELCIISGSVDLNIQFPVFENNFVLEAQYSQIINFPMIKISSEEYLSADHQFDGNDLSYFEDMLEPEEGNEENGDFEADTDKNDDCISVQYMLESEPQFMAENKKAIEAPKAWKSQQTGTQPTKNRNLLNLFLNKNKICVFD